MIDGTKVLSQVEDKTEKPDEFEFEANEVYALDFCMTTGEGKVNHQSHVATTETTCVSDLSVCVCAWTAQGG